jgi:hypothetical protein
MKMKLVAYGEYEEYRAIELGGGEWLMSPEGLATYASKAKLPETVVTLGTMVVYPALDSKDEIERFEAAKWIIETFAEMSEPAGTLLDWDVEGYDPQIDDGNLPDDTVF